MLSIAALALFSAPYPCAQPAVQADWSGTRWEGGYGEPHGAVPSWNPLLVSVETVGEDGAATGRVHWVSPGGGREAPLEGRVDGAAIRGEFADGRKRLALGTRRCSSCTGRGPATRGAGAFGSFFASLGFAVASVDKRGVGESEGTYEMPDGGNDDHEHMTRRARDVAAGLRALAADARLDAERLGLPGGSQAGWVIPQAARHAPPAFTVTISGGATRLEIENYFSEIADELDATPDSISIDAAVERTRRRAKRARGPSFREHFEALECPGLWLYGLNDRVNPSQLCVELLEEVRDASGKDFTIATFAHGNHALLESELGGLSERWRLRRFAPGVFTTLGAWLAEKVPAR